MKAKDLKPGDTVGGIWTVKRVFEACGVLESSTHHGGDSKMSAFGRLVSRIADPWNTIIHVELERGIPDPATWRTWYLADEEVEGG
jgi:hypothetical protein